MKSSIVWAGVALVGIIAALSVGLSFAGWKDQSILGWTVGIGVFAGTVFGLIAKVESKTDAQTQQLQQISTAVGTVEKRVNGELDARIAAAMEEAAEMGAGRVLSVLRQQGVIR